MKNLLNFIWPFKKSAPVLMYHRFGPRTTGDPWLFVSRPALEEQLDLLIKKGCKFLSFTDVEAARANGSALPENAVMITIDDGWLDNFTHAYPVFKEKNVCANIFLNAALIGVDEQYLTWEHVSEMQKSGLINFASHGMNHRRLRALTQREILFELTESKKIIEQKTARAVKSFCYPYGAADRRVRKLVFKAGYTVDYGTRKGRARWPWNWFSPVKRIMISASDDINVFERKVF